MCGIIIDTGLNLPEPTNFNFESKLSFNHAFLLPHIRLLYCISIAAAALNV